MIQQDCNISGGHALWAWRYALSHRSSVSCVRIDALLVGGSGHRKKLLHALSLLYMIPLCGLDMHNAAAPATDLWFCFYRFALETYT